MRIVLTGASGSLGAYLVKELVRRGHDVIAWSGSRVGERSGIPLVPVDLEDGDAIGQRLDRDDPDAVIHAAALSAAEVVRRDPERGHRLNVLATRAIADWCGRHGRRLVYTSTDLVFDGSRPWNREDDPAEPILAYGRTKRDAEFAVTAIPTGLVARLSLLFGPSLCGRDAFFDRAIAALARGEPQTFFDDEFRTPLNLTTAARTLVRLTELEVAGIVHVGGVERMSRHELMSRAAAALGLDGTLVRANRRDEFASAEPRPADASLDTSRLAGLLPDLKRPTVEEALTSSDEF
jgi:dTDP-4-dehydrorhamnose reductase